MKPSVLSPGAVLLANFDHATESASFATHDVVVTGDAPADIAARVHAERVADQTGITTRFNEAPVNVKSDARPDQSQPPPRQWRSQTPETNKKPKSRPHENKKQTP